MRVFTEGRVIKMNIIEANKIRYDFYELTNPTEEEQFLYTEALSFLIDETKNPDSMVELGCFYYEQRRFDLALKYYELAAEYDNTAANTCLGYIWYYGRTGEKNYEKAFHYYEKARQKGDIIAGYKVADMYRNGYYVEKDIEKYRQIIEELYQKLEDSPYAYFNDPVPEISIRLAQIRTEEGKTEEALRLYDKAREILSRRIQDHSFFGDRNIMKWMIQDVYKIRAFDKEDMSLYDLFWVLQKPARVSFCFEERKYEVQSEEETGECAIRFDGKWYRTIDDFFAKAEIDGELLTTLYEEFYDFEVI